MPAKDLQALWKASYEDIELGSREDEDKDFTEERKEQWKFCHVSRALVCFYASSVGRQLKQKQDKDFNDPVGDPFEFDTALKFDGQDYMRLLELLPGQPHDDIHCKLQTVPLAAAPAYHALSYCWGDPDDTLGVFVGHKVAQVTQNLRSALRHLRLKTASRLFWIDALCINQQDTDEKEYQLELMARFFGSAVKTVIWLGPASSISQRALYTAYIFARAEEAERTAHVINPATDIQWAPEATILVKGCLDPDPESGTVWTGELRSLLTRSWFSRAWIVQEVILSGSTELHCGFNSLAWSAFVRAIKYGYQKHRFIRRNGAVMWLNPVESAYTFVPERLDDASKNPAEALLAYLIELRHRHATVPVDKVFSLLGLVYGAQAIGIQPDYRSTTDEVYRNVTIQILKRTNNLDVFGGIWTNSRDSSPISWIADWTPDRPWAEPLAYTSRKYASPLNATGGSISTVKFEDGDRTLIMLGHRFGKVEGISHPFPAFSYDDVAKFEIESASAENTDWGVEGHYQVLKNNIEYMHNLGDLIKDGANMLIQATEVLLEWEKFAGVGKQQIEPDRQYWKTLCAERYIDGNEALTELEYQKWYHHLSNHRRLAKMPGALQRSKTFAIFEHQRTAYRQATRFPEVLKPSFGRNLARVNGHLALVPRAAQVGDEIVLCQGGRVPLLARRDGSAWTLLGEAYVNGIMQGQAYQEGLCEGLAFI